MKGSTKAVLVLVVIALCSALLLSVLSDVLYVSDDDKDNMKLKSVHASAVTERITNVSEKYGEAAENEKYGSVTGVYRCEDGAVIIKAKGTGGYSGGWVETYVAIGKDGVILNVVVSGNKNQSFISSVKQSWLDGQFGGKSADGEFVLNVDVSPASGASKSSNATVNSVNMAIYFYNNVIKNEEALEEENYLKSNVLNENLTKKNKFSESDNAIVCGYWESASGKAVVAVKSKGEENAKFYIVISREKILKIVIVSGFEELRSNESLLNKTLNSDYIGKKKGEYGKGDSGLLADPFDEMVDLAFECYGNIGEVA